MSLSSGIKKALERSNFRSAAEFARAIGMNETQMPRYLSGKSEPSASILAKMAKALGCSMDTLMYGGEESSEYSFIELYSLHPFSSEPIYHKKVMDRAMLDSLKILDALSIELGAEQHVTFTQQVYEYYLQCLDSDEQQPEPSNVVSIAQEIAKRKVS
ncbi:MAG: helix-turn-helix transcriptional regulator [Alphaproteobacteria bacterium]|nr:helix-turn-helix transcriptional regulator [Alphaproteobacteria bacterium]MDD9919748.1 helix-turn-helix transcriptional regulator [Alphaproteobacteria bacterium]